MDMVGTWLSRFTKGGARLLSFARTFFAAAAPTPLRYGRRNRQARTSFCRLPFGTCRGAGCCALLLPSRCCLPACTSGACRSASLPSQTAQQACSSLLFILYLSSSTLSLPFPSAVPFGGTSVYAAAAELIHCCFTLHVCLRYF